MKTLPFRTPPLTTTPAIESANHRVGSGTSVAAMLPKYLYSSYKQYKSDTNTIGNWLVTTAKNYGYQLDHLLNPRSIEEETQVESPRRPRLKGKARKAAKEQKPIDSVDDEKHPLSTKDFVPLADYIAKKSKGILDLSLDFADRLDRAINLRREHAAHYHSSLEKKVCSDPSPEPDNLYIYVRIHRQRGALPGTYRHRY